MPDAADSFPALWEKLEGLEPGSPLRHRLYRALNWLERAAAEDDLDARCIFLWVAFNASYAIERKAEIAERGEEGEPREYQRRARYFGILTRCNSRRLHGTARARLWRPISSVMNNVYIFRGFWDSLEEEEFNWDSWERKREFEVEREVVREELGAVAGRNTFRMLTTVFNRLYVLRNQLMHGCATPAGSVNRRQVEDGVQILATFVPVFLDMMMDHPEEDWGKISFPVRDDIREEYAGQRR